MELEVVVRLRECGHDALTSFEAGTANLGLGDGWQLDFARRRGRAILSHNRRHFQPLHRRGAPHAGIICCTFDEDFAALAARINSALADPRAQGRYCCVVDKSGHRFV